MELGTSLIFIRWMGFIVGHWWCHFENNMGIRYTYPDNLVWVGLVWVGLVWVELSWFGLVLGTVKHCQIWSHGPDGGFLSS